SSLLSFFFFFFFSSRRRHTRFSRDWSSDVCSSDLPVHRPDREGGPPMTRAAAPRLRGAVSSSRPQWARTVHRHLRVYVYLWLWLWAICIVGAAVAVVVTDRFGTVNVSVLQFVRNGPMVWFLFALGIIVSTTYLGV